MGERYVDIVEVAGSIPAAPTINMDKLIKLFEEEQFEKVIKGADKKISLPYSDPRVADNTGLEKEVYNQTCSIIAKEMFYLMKQVKKIV